LVDVGSEIFDKAPQQIQVLMLGHQKQGPVAILFRLVDIDTTLLDEVPH
jgi:hypothetical protein